MEITKNDIIQLVTESVNEVLSCLGASYYNGTDIRKLAHLVKRGDVGAIKKAAEILHKYVPVNSILIPIPSHGGKSTYTKVLAKELANMSRARVMDILRSEPREMLYKSKKLGGDPGSVDLKFMGINGNVEKIKQILHTASNVILIDNVVDSGVTYEQAHRKILELYGVDAWMLSLGVVEKSEHDPGESRVIRSIIPYE